MQLSSGHTLFTYQVEIKDWNPCPTGTCAIKKM
jgi:hypothetical protein